jgi:prephenate dehydratase
MSSRPGKQLPRVGYLGPAGTFTEEALRRSVCADAVEEVALGSIYETILAVRDRRVRWALVPIENSLDGSVTVTLDLLAETRIRTEGACLPASVETGTLADSGMRAERVSPESVAGECPPTPGEEHGDLEIVGEVLLAVRHALIATEATALVEIDTIVSHPQVPGQCTRLLRGELARAQVLPASSTAEAVRRVVGERRHGQAALGTKLAAEIYGGTVLCDGVQDRDDNVTRFVWLAQAEDGAGEPPLLSADRGAGERKWKTSVVFWGSGADSPGWLVRCLQAFATREINLTKIESRPRRARLGHYMFFADLEGDARDPTIAQALDGLRAVSEYVRILGSYPAAEDPLSG